MDIGGSWEWFLSVFKQGFDQNEISEELPNSPRFGLGEDHYPNSLIIGGTVACGDKVTYRVRAENPNVDDPQRRIGAVNGDFECPTTFREQLGDKSISVTLREKTADFFFRIKITTQKIDPSVPTPAPVRQLPRQIPTLRPTTDVADVMDICQYTVKVNSVFYGGVSIGGPWTWKLEVDGVIVEEKAPQSPLFQEGKRDEPTTLSLSEMVPCDSFIRFSVKAMRPGRERNARELSFRCDAPRVVNGRTAIPITNRVERTAVFLFEYTVETKKV